AAGDLHQSRRGHRVGRRTRVTGCVSCGNAARLAFTAPTSDGACVPSPFPPPNINLRHVTRNGPAFRRVRHPQLPAVSGGVGTGGVIVGLG
ncbi:MAG TPA: hypothetical protein PKC18_12100, partial [Lacipirellulaceae bacterium]|nr:hypothetical protein [Lacipirellulaceae bacterium]